MHFYKYHGLGNDYLVIDPAHVPEPLSHRLTPEWARAICDRNTGIGADGIVYGPLAPAVDAIPKQGNPGFSCQIWNPDGSRAQISGNGLRIFARYLREQNYVEARRPGSADPDCVVYSTDRGIEVRFGAGFDDPIQVALGKAQILGVDTPVNVAAPLPLQAGALLKRAVLVDVGNPHCVFFLDDSSAHGGDAFLQDLTHQLGPLVETAPQFPQRTNVQFAQVADAHLVRIEIWERGAGYTLASGSSACAVATAAVATGRCVSPVQIATPGGILVVDVIRDDENWNVSLTGPVSPVCAGRFALSWLSSLREIPDSEM